jgi:nitrite reductase (NO-forming)
MVNLLGWVGLTVLGTLVTLWPTMLRTRMAPDTETASRTALPILLAGLTLVVVGPLVDQPLVGAAGLVIYLAGTVWAGRTFVIAARNRPPAAFPTLSAGAGLLWLPVGLVAMAWSLATSGSWAAIADNYGKLTTIFVVGFALQVLLGALTYLLPIALGGGPSVLRAGMTQLEKGGTIRVVVTNVGLALSLLPVPSLVRVVLSTFVLVALASFIPLMFKGIHASVRARRELVDTPAGTPAKDGAVTRPATAWSRPQLVAGLAIVAVGASLGVGLDPAAAGLTLAAGQAASAEVQPTGHTTRVTVTAKDMRFTPSEISVPAGDTLVIDLVNADPKEVHDLVLATGASSGRLSPGGKKAVEVGVVGADIDGWCSVVGHRQMGMVFTVKAVGAAAPASGAAGGATNQAAGGHAAHGHGATTTTPSGTVPALDFMKKPGADFTAYDPVLAPLTNEKVHRITLTVEEVVVEVAPGVTQKRWTYNGQAPGPTLHGRVGDVFEITLVNHGTTGHSIDFHAGENNPDEVMRTIPPGESLLYRFTARRSGIWMYHCSTMPMATHIAAGMHGAVVIEPEGLPAVDRSYVMVQSEVYLGGQGEPVNAEKVTAEKPDAVVFNGYAGQYAARPLAAKVGERVRIWVLDAGPNRPSSFHVVGGQFDTTYSEGTYLLRGGRGPLDAPGVTTGGSQALGLQAAQGGFVEMTFPAPGNYKFVSHLMVDAERGANGVIAVTR